VTLPEARLVVAWTSVPLLQLRLKELVLVRPTLAVRRDANGVLHLGSLSLDPGQDKQGPGATQWLLRQRRISIHDGSIAWDDEQHGGPPLTLEQVEFRLENGFGHHRFGMTGVPPRELAAPLD